jgi:hypothetical protein
MMYTKYTVRIIITDNYTYAYRLTYSFFVLCTEVCLTHTQTKFCTKLPAQHKRLNEFGGGGV